jgi:hypothetical protein
LSTDQKLNKMTIHIAVNNEYLCKDSWLNYTELRLRQPEHFKIEDLDSRTGLNEVCTYCKKEYAIRKSETQVSRTTDQN